MRLIRNIRAKWNGRNYQWLAAQIKEYDGSVAYAGGGDSGGSEVVATGPFGPQIPFIMELFNQAQGLLESGQGTNFPTFDTVASANPALVNSQQDIIDFVNNQSGVNQGAIDALAGNAAAAGTDPVSQVAGQLSPDLISGIQSLIGAGQNPLAAAGEQAIGGATGALNAATGAATGAIPGLNVGGAPTNPNALDITSALTESIQGRGLNPFINQTVEGATRSLRDQFAESTLPQIRSAATQAGQPGGTRQGIAEGIAGKGLGNNIADITAQLFAQGFDVNAADRANALGLVSDAASGNLNAALQSGNLNELIRSNIIGQGLQGAQIAGGQLGQGLGLGFDATGTGTAQAGNLLQSGANNAQTQLLQSLGLLPALQASGLSQLGASNQVGLQQLGLDQAQIDAAINEFFFNEFAPINALSQFQNFISGSFGSSVPGQNNDFSSINPPTFDFSGGLPAPTPVQPPAAVVPPATTDPIQFPSL